VTGYGDGAMYNASLVGGIKLGDRGHLVVAGNYSKREGVKYAARSFANRTLCSDDLTQMCGSSNTTPTAFDIPGAGRQQIQADGTLSSNVAGYNFNPINYAQTPMERWGGMALWNYDVSDHVEMYGWGSYQHVKTVQTLAPTATAGFRFNISQDNPYLTDPSAPRSSIRPPTPICGSTPTALRPSAFAAASPKSVAASRTTPARPGRF
jgi:hypothetical protein